MIAEVRIAIENGSAKYLVIGIVFVLLVWLDEINESKREISKRRYTVFRFPSPLGSGRDFRFKLVAWLWVRLVAPSGMVYEIKDKRSGKYQAYWISKP